MPKEKPSTLVIGVGNPDRGDDAVGPLVASRLKRRTGDNFEVIEQAGDGLALMEAWEGVDTVIILDAAKSGAAAVGEIHRVDATSETMPRDLFRCSTHALGVAESIELARVLFQLPRRIIVYGIEGQRFDAGADLSAAVAEAANKLETLVLREIETAAPPTSIATPASGAGYG